MAEHRRVAWNQEGYLRLVRQGCFVCELLAGNPDYAHHVAYRDDTAVAFLNRFPLWFGHLLVAPTAHREHVIGDLDAGEYLALQAGCSRSRARPGRRSRHRAALRVQPR